MNALNQKESSSKRGLSREGGPAFIEFESAGKTYYRCKCKDVWLDRRRKGCNVCEQQVLIGDSFPDVIPRKTEFFEGKRDFEFRELVSGLIPNPKLTQERMIKGCQVAFPDTIFFSNEGLAELVVSNDKEMCMANDQKIKLSKEMHNIK
jgi:hypothetical protein